MEESGRERLKRAKVKRVIKKSNDPISKLLERKRERNKNK